MTYKLREYREYRLDIAGKTINDKTITEGAFSINIIGDGHESFSQEISEAFYWVGCNFENNAGFMPLSPIVGQTWYDSFNRRLMVYGSDLTWRAVPSSTFNGAFADNFTPSEDSAFDIGSEDFIYKDGFATNIYANTITYENSNGSSQYIVIDENDNTALLKETNLYPSVTNNTDFMTDIDNLSNTANNSTTAALTTTTEIVDISVTGALDVSTDIRNNKVLVISEFAGILEINIDIPSTMDSIITVSNDSDEAIEIFITSSLTVNFVYGAITSVFVPARSTGKLTTYKTNAIDTVDVVLEFG